MDLDSDLAAPSGPGRHPLPEPTSFRERLEEAGIGSADEVVAYDDAAGSIAARLWWMLDSLGHPDVAVLDGGLAAWVAAGLPLSTMASTYPPASLTLSPSWTRTIDRDALRAGLGEFRLLDVRAPERYRGEREPVDPVAGHIPTAVSAPIAGNVDADGRFLTPTALAARYRALGAGGDGDDVVVQCGSGINACQAALAMRLAGLADPLLYPGSYSDWSRAGLPVVTGPEPGRSEGIARESPAPRPPA
jgi:thiosulfate/3-mercaptopyruvate sulfurtransferase